ncbi:hypothetical protein [Terrabacter sp. NPDC080008]|uniref:hypothetical protein n=1 Tax=Terrabacter sp. NPDC080008 TaxID=3155176 RepID=UPI00344D81D0
MNDDMTRGPDAAPEPGEAQLRKALSAMNDLRPPRDDLFVERALMRGRARTSRRRSTLLGAAAAVVVVGVVGGSWVAADHGSPSSASSGAGARTAAGSSAEAPGSLRSASPGAPGSGGAAPSVPSARDATRWFDTLSTPQTNTFEAIEPTVVSRWPDVFSGAYAVTPAGDRVAVAVTRHDSGLETFVTQAMPSPSDVEFVVRAHTFAEKQRVEQEIADQRTAWSDKGIDILRITQDGRADRVAVVLAAGSSPTPLEQRYGDVVEVTVASPASGGKLPDGRTLPPLQR